MGSGVDSQLGKSVEMDEETRVRGQDSLNLPVMSQKERLRFLLSPISSTCRIGVSV